MYRLEFASGSKYNPSLKLLLKTSTIFKGFKVKVLQVLNLNHYSILAYNQFEIV